MNCYKTLYTLTVEHEYFDRGKCRAIQCMVSPRNIDLWRQRGLLFRAIDLNQWTILFDSNGTGVDTSSDVLMLDLTISDPAFVLYTRLDDFRSSSSYGLDLPAASNTVEVAQSIRKTSSQQTSSRGFCTIHLRLTDELLRAAQEGNPESCTLVFHAQECRWEYLLDPYADDMYASTPLLIEEYNGKLTFPSPEPVMEYGRRMLRTVSNETVRMHERYDYRLKLTAEGNASRRRVLLTSLPLPQPGEYLDASPGLLRQICRF